MPVLKHILVIRLSAMGDVAMAVPVLRAFNHHYPNVKITVLTKGFFKPFFRNLPNVTVFEADLKGKHKGIFGLWRLTKELNVIKFDAVADFHNVLRTKILKFFFFFFGKKFIQIDKGRSEKKALITWAKISTVKILAPTVCEGFRKFGFSARLIESKFSRTGFIKS